MRNILVPTDFSNNAFHALNYISDLLENKECDFFLLHAFTEKKGFKSQRIDSNSEEFLKKSEEDSKIRLERFLFRVKKKKDNPKHTYTLICERNELTQVLNSLIDKLDIDLLVMGNKGKESSIPIFLGRRATKTLQSVKKCPVLTVPKNAEFSMPKVIAFATDLKKPFNAKIMKPLRDLALRCGAVIQVMHIGDEEALEKSRQLNLDALLTYFDPLVTSVRRIPNFISKTKIIQVFIKESEIDMLVMVNNEHGILEKILREPIIEKMVFHIDIPFLVLPDTS